MAVEPSNPKTDASINLLTALQGLVTQWKALGDEMERNNRDAWADEIRIYGACANELSAILAGVPEPPTNDDDVTRRDSLTPIAPPQPAPTITALMRDCPDCRFYGPVPCPGCGRPVEAVNARLLQPTEVQTVSFNDLPQHLELHESGVSQQSAQPRGIGARLADAGETIRLRSEVNRWRSVVRRVIDIANSQELDEGDIAELKALSEEVERGVPEGAAPGAPALTRHVEMVEVIQDGERRCVPLPGAAATPTPLLDLVEREIQKPGYGILRGWLAIHGGASARIALEEITQLVRALTPQALPSPPDGWQAEACICAAIRLDDGEVFRGHRHVDAIRTAGKAGCAMTEKKKYDSTVARIAGNIASSCVGSWGQADAEPIAAYAVTVARAIVAEVQRTEPKGDTP